MKTRNLLIDIACVLIMLGAAHAADGEAQWGPYFLGYETEPAMDYGGKSIAAIHTCINDAIFPLVEGHPIIMALVELPLGLGGATVHHEVFGHGGRAQEFDLGPSYTFTYTLTGRTDVRTAPRSNEELLAYYTGGFEATQVLGHRLLLDLCRREAPPASTISLMLMSKVNLTQSILNTKPPTQEDAGSSDPETFTGKYKGRKDIATYLVARQAQRGGAPVDEVWNRQYEPDLSDPALQKNWDQVKEAAVWNILDPMMWRAAQRCITEHFMQGDRRVPPPAWEVDDGTWFTVGTRAALGPEAITRFLDVYLIGLKAMYLVYARDLVSATDRTYGFGGGVYDLEVGERFGVNVEADVWTSPQGEEDLEHGSGWNVMTELEARVSGGCELLLKLGGKSDGWLPGTPIEKGAYVGGGVRLTF